MLWGQAEAKTIVVDDDWDGADYKSIQAAVDAAMAGDTIRVYDGQYDEPVIVNKRLNLIGNGSYKTVIQGWRLDHAHGIEISADGCNVSGFHFYKCHPTHEFGGIGVYSSYNRIFNNYFQDNNNGIYVTAPNNNITNNSFSLNLYGIRVDQGADDCNYSFNRFNTSIIGAVIYQYSSRIVFFSNTFENNNQSVLSFYRTSDITVSFNMFEDNNAASSARSALMLYKSSENEVHNNTFYRNNRGISLGEANNTHIRHNAIYGNSEGIRVSRTVDGFTVVNLTVNYNKIYNNKQSGIEVLNHSGKVIDAEYNWWGDASGPYHPTNNSAGKGDNVTDQLDFDPWLRAAEVFPPIAFILDIQEELSHEGDPVHFYGQGLARNWIALHSWRSSMDGELYNGSAIGFARSTLSNGSHVIYLKVKDTFGRWSKEVNFTLIVNGRPRAEIVSIIPPFRANEGEEVQFNGGYVDHEDDIVEFYWGSDIDGLLGDEQNISITNLTNGTHIIGFRVKDGYGIWSKTATRDLVVNGMPRAWIVSIEPDHVNETEIVIFRGDCLDNEGDVSRFQWGSDIDGDLSDQKLFYTSSLSNGTHAITFRVMDSYGEWSLNATANVTVNGKPRARIDDILPDPAEEGSDVIFYGNFTDHENDIAEFYWESDIDGVLSSDRVFSVSNLSRGIHLILYRVKDGNGVWSEIVTRILTINGVPQATIIDIQPPSANEGETIAFYGDFIDAEYDVVEFKWVSDIDGLVSTLKDFSTSGLSNGTHTILFRVRDGYGAWSDDATGTVTINGVPRASIVDITPSSANEGGVVEFLGGYLDFEDDIAEFSWVSDIDGPLSTEKDFMTSSLSNGTHAILFRVRDGHGIWSDNATGTITVNGVPRGTIIRIWPNPTFEGDEVEFTGEGSDDGTVVEFRWSSSIDGVIGNEAAFTHSLLSAGDHEIVLRVRDDSGAWSENVTYPLEVKENEVKLEIARILFPRTAHEGQSVTIEVVMENVARIPVSDITVHFYYGDERITSMVLEGPLGSGSQKTISIGWLAVLGNHTVLVELEHDGAIISSERSDTTMVVSEKPDDGDGNGKRSQDSSITILMIVIIASVLMVITAYFLRSRIG
jgi:parallel beta-helix repeat protein